MKGKQWVSRACLPGVYLYKQKAFSRRHENIQLKILVIFSAFWEHNMDTAILYFAFLIFSTSWLRFRTDEVHLLYRNKSTPPQYKCWHIHTKISTVTVQSLAWRFPTAMTSPHTLYLRSYSMLWFLNLIHVCSDILKPFLFYSPLRKYFPWIWHHLICCTEAHWGGIFTWNT